MFKQQHKHRCFNVNNLIRRLVDGTLLILSTSDHLGKFPLGGAAEPISSESTNYQRSRNSFRIPERIKRSINYIAMSADRCLLNTVKTSIDNSGYTIDKGLNIQY